MRKRLLIYITLLLLSFSTVGYAQLRGINYQAVAIDENGMAIAGIDVDGQPLDNKTIGVRFSILEAGPTGSVLYQEYHITNTDQYGLFSVIIGDGINTGSGQYADITKIQWSLANQFLKVEIDIQNNGDFKIMSIQ